MPKTSNKISNKTNKTNKTTKTIPKTKQNKQIMQPRCVSIDFSKEKGIDSKYKDLKVNLYQTKFNNLKVKPIKGQTYKNKSKFIQIAVKSTSLLDKKQMEFITNFLNNNVYKNYGDKYKIEARNAIKSGAYCMEKNRYLIEQEDLKHKINEFMVDSNEKDIIEYTKDKETNTFYITYYLKSLL